MFSQNFFVPDEIQPKMNTNLPEYYCQMAKQKMDTGWFGPNYVDAIKYFVKGANEYQLRGSNRLAAHTYIGAAVASSMMGNINKTGYFYDKAASMINDIDKELYHIYLKNAINHYYQSKNFLDGARSCVKLAIFCEKENNIDEAIELLEKATEIYESENFHSLVSDNRERMGNLYIKKGNYNLAIEMYERIIDQFINAKMYPKLIKNKIVKIIICYLVCDDSIGAQVTYEKYNKKPYFHGTYEQEFSNSCINSFNNLEEDELEKIFQHHELFITNNLWFMNMLDELKKIINKKQIISS
jgi:tetratricopeptide (TPR) repeat protein